MVILFKLFNNCYRIIEILGRGGFGEIFLVQDIYMFFVWKCVIKYFKLVLENLEIFLWLWERFYWEVVILEELGENYFQIF